MWALNTRRGPSAGAAGQDVAQRVDLHSSQSGPSSRATTSRTRSSRPGGPAVSHSSASRGRFTRSP